MRDEAVQMLRGSVYLARLRLAKLEAADADTRAIRDARRALEQVEERAREEGIAPWATTPESPSDGTEPRARFGYSGGDSAAAAFLKGALNSETTG